MMEMHPKKWKPGSVIAVFVLLLLFVSFTGQAIWKSLPVQVPRTTHLSLFGEVINGLDAIDALAQRGARELHEYPAGKFYMLRLVIENRSNAEMVLSLDRSAVVMPGGSSHTLRELCKGELASFVAPGAYIDDIFSLPAGLTSGSLVKLFLRWEDIDGSHYEFWTWQAVYEAPIRQKVFLNSLQGPYASLVNEHLNTWINSIGAELTYRRDDAQFILDIKVASASSRRRTNWWFFIFPAWPLVPLSVREAEVVVRVSIVSSTTGTSLLNNSFQGEARKYFWGDFVSRDYALRKAFERALGSLPNLPALAPQ